MSRARAHRRSGMGKDLAERFPAARDTFAAIDDALGVAALPPDVGGPRGRAHPDAQRPARHPRALRRGAARWSGERLGAVAAAAGHSLGEYSAYVAAGALTAADGGAAGAPARRADVRGGRRRARARWPPCSGWPPPRWSRRLRRGVRRRTASRWPPTSTRPTRRSSRAIRPRSARAGEALQGARAPSASCRSR